MFFLSSSYSLYQYDCRRSSYCKYPNMTIAIILLILFLLPILNMTIDFPIIVHIQYDSRGSSYPFLIVDMIIDVPLIVNIQI